MSHQQVRKDLNVNNPVQAKRSSGQKEHPFTLQPRSGLNSYGVRDRGGASSTPSCASLARGYSH